MVKNRKLKGENPRENNKPENKAITYLDMYQSYIEGDITYRRIYIFLITFNLLILLFPVEVTTNLKLDIVVESFNFGSLEKLCITTPPLSLIHI